MVSGITGALIIMLVMSLVEKLVELENSDFSVNMHTIQFYAIENNSQFDY